MEFLVILLVVYLSYRFVLKPIYRMLRPETSMYQVNVLIDRKKQSLMIKGKSERSDFEKKAESLVKKKLKSSDFEIMSIVKKPS